MTTGAPGTYVIGVSTAPRVLGMTAQEFNDYLTHDGVLDALAARKTQGTLDGDAREQYAKHVKAIIQVGEARTGSYDHVLGYPMEIVPLVNPYTLSVGDEMAVRVLKQGVPVSNQLVYANYEGHHGHNAEGEHEEAIQTRTDADGVARFKLSHEGRWYVRLIHMMEIEAHHINYASEWATLTFEMQ